MVWNTVKLRVKIDKSLFEFLNIEIDVLIAIRLYDV